MSAVLAVVNLLPTAPIDRQAELINDAFANMRTSMEQAGGWAIVVGLECIEAKKLLGETRGRPQKNSSGVRTNYPDTPETEQTSEPQTFDLWIKENCPDLARSTAYEYIRIARESKAGLLKNGSDAIRSLLDLAPSQLTPEQRALLHKEVKGYADGRSVSQLMLDFGLVKRGRKTGKGTGNNGADTKALYDPEAPEPGWDPAIWQLLCTAQELEDTQAVSAIELCHSLEISLLSETAADTFAHLPPLALSALHAAVRAADTQLTTLTSPKGAKR